jgi:hypothetical protein
MATWAEYEQWEMQRLDKLDYYFAQLTALVANMFAKRPAPLTKFLFNRPTSRIRKAAPGELKALLHFAFGTADKPPEPANG